MLLFGVLGDIYGRRKMYGLELIILIIGTVGVLMSSTGYVPLNKLSGIQPETVDWGSYGSMNIQSWLLLWRFVTGIGIGGDVSLVLFQYCLEADKNSILFLLSSSQSSQQLKNGLKCSLSPFRCKH